MKTFAVILTSVLLLPGVPAYADSFGLVSVPEAGSMLLLGIALFGLAWAARRRTRRV